MCTFFLIDVFSGQVGILSLRDAPFIAVIYCNNVQKVFPLGIGRVCEVGVEGEPTCGHAPCGPVPCPKEPDAASLLLLELEGNVNGIS